jgi:hypothetical protein
MTAISKPKSDLRPPTAKPAYDPANDRRDLGTLQAPPISPPKPDNEAYGRDRFGLPKPFNPEHLPPPGSGSLEPRRGGCAPIDPFAPAFGTGIALLAAC